MGQPAWLWAIGAVVVVGGYLWLKHSQSSSSSSSGSGGTPTGKGGAGATITTGSFQEWVTQHQGSPKRRGRK